MPLPAQIPIRFFICFVFFLGYAPLSVSAQNRVTDSSVTCIAFWKKGEERKLRIIQSKEKSGSPAQENASFTYEAYVTILDSSDEGYKVRWVFHQAELHNGKVSQPVAGVPVFDGMKFIFLVSETGTFKSLVNWEEVRDGYVNLMKLSLPKNPSPELESIVEKTIAMFNRREVVESTLINEIQIYHGIYGREYDRKEIKSPSEIPFPLGGGIIPAITTISVTLPPGSSQFYSLSVHTEMDMNTGRKFIAEILSKMDLDKPIEYEELEREIAEMKVNESSEYQVGLTDGWIRQVNMIRNTKIRNLSQKHWYSIELID